MRLLVDPVQAHLGREGQNGGAVGVGVSRTEKEIDGAGSQSGRADAGLAGEPAVHLGHERRRLLVADQHVANGGPGKRIGQMDVLLARDAEHACDALVLEALDEELSRTPSSFGHSSERSESWRDRNALHLRCPDPGPMVVP